MPDGYERTAEERDEARSERDRTAEQRDEARRQRERTRRPNGGGARRSSPARRRSARPSRLRKWGGRFLARARPRPRRRRDLVPGRAVPAVPRLAAWQRHGHDPAAFDLRRDRRSACARRRGLLGLLLRPARDARRRARRPARRHLQPPAGHDLQQGAQGADDGARAARRRPTSRSSRAGRGPRSTRC